MSEAGSSRNLFAYVRRWAGVLVGLACLGLGCPGAAHSQAGAQTGPNIQVRVTSVSAPVVVRDAKGKLVQDLREANFRVFDNGVQQRIESFDVGGAPISVAIVIETSSRVAPILSEISHTGTLFTQTVLGADGDAAIIGYNDDVDVLQGFTGDPDAIEKTFAHLNEGTSGARLYDAMARAVYLLRARPDSRRRVLITMAESVDTSSDAKLGQVLRDAQLANIVIYSIGLSTARAAIHEERAKQTPEVTPPGTFSLPPMPGEPQTPDTEAIREGKYLSLTEAAELAVKDIKYDVHGRPLEIADTATGGLYQSTFFKESIDEAIDQISAELHAQYMLTYRPTGAGTRDYHQIRVEVVGKRGLKVRSRPGYYVEPGAQG